MYHGQQVSLVLLFPNKSQAGASSRAQCSDSSDKHAQSIFFSKEIVLRLRSCTIQERVTYLNRLFHLLQHLPIHLEQALQAQLTVERLSWSSSSP